MPKLVGVRERRHQPYWDHLIRVGANTSPSPTVQQTTSLFNGTNVGLEFWTNMDVAGMFASDNTFVVLAMRVQLLFIGPSATRMYQLAMNQLYLQLNIGDKPQFSGPAFLFPAGGGLYGDAEDVIVPQGEAAPLVVGGCNLVNGMPTAESLLKFAKPIPIPARQHFKVIANLYDVDSDDTILPGSLKDDYLNASGNGEGEPPIGLREIAVFLDGIHTREVL
jgi:hypothetical protein